MLALKSFEISVKFTPNERSLLIKFQGTHITPTSDPISYTRATHPTFNTVFVLKTFFYANPIQFITIWISFVALVVGYAVYVFEREVQPEEVTFIVACYVLFIIKMFIVILVIVIFHLIRLGGRYVCYLYAYILGV
jgi:hypothetical protein